MSLVAPLLFIGELVQAGALSFCVDDLIAFLLRLLVMIAAWTDHPLAARRRAMATTAWTDAQPPSAETDVLELGLRELALADSVSVGEGGASFALPPGRWSLVGAAHVATWHRAERALVLSSGDHFSCRLLDAEWELDLGFAATPLDLERVLINLVKNAREATAPGEEVRLTLGRDGERVRLSVSDPGRGMDAETQGRAFQPGFSTKSGTGRGLGLASVRRLVERNGGSLACESAPGRGTRVDLSFPVA